MAVRQVNGVRVEAEEVEAVLRRCDSLVAAAAVALDPSGLAAWVVLSDPARAAVKAGHAGLVAEALAAHCAAEMPARQVRYSSGGLWRREGWARVLVAAGPASGGPGEARRDCWWRPTRKARRK
jgi:hypothetical protein